MKQWKKEIKQAQLDREKEVYKELEKVYKQALKDVQDKSKKLQSQIDKLVEADPDNESLIRSKVYQLNYQNTIKQQLDDAMNRLSNADTITAYMEDMYKEGYISQFYALQKQGVPVLAPINHEKMLTALTYNTANIPLSTRLYNNVDKAKKQILGEITRGIASGMSGQDVARNIQNRMGVSYRKARQLAQNEGHRVNTQAVMDGMHTAKERGADIVKQWDCTYDKKTRPEHRELDQKWVEVDDYFKWSGGEVFAPKEFGVARLDINCRCALLSVPRWDVEDGVKKHYDNIKGEIIEAKNYDDWKNKYYNISDKYSDTSKITYDVRSGTNKLQKVMKPDDYEEYMNVLENCENEGIKKLYSNYFDRINTVRQANDGYYDPFTKSLVYHIDARHENLSKFHVVAHESGHAFDFLADFEGLTFNEIEFLNSKVKIGSREAFERIASTSDQFLDAYRKDKENIRKILSKEIIDELKVNHASHGVQDIIESMTDQTIRWGHGHSYWVNKYRRIKTFKKHNDLKNAYKELGYDVKTLRDTVKFCRDYTGSCESWANIADALTNGGDSLMFVQKYCPNMYDAMVNILKGVK